MTEERKIELALDGVASNIVFECRLIVNDEIHVHDGIETLRNLLEEYGELIDKYHEIKSNRMTISETDAEELADRITQRIQERLLEPHSHNQQ